MIERRLSTTEHYCIQSCCDAAHSTQDLKLLCRCLQRHPLARGRLFDGRLVILGTAHAERPLADALVRIRRRRKRQKYFRSVSSAADAAAHCTKI
jgi:hypothetical protein